MTSSEDLRSVVRHLMFRFGSINNYNFGGRYWYGQVTSKKNEKEDNRKQYVRDMMWVRELVTTSTTPKG